MVKCSVIIDAMLSAIFACLFFFYERRYRVNLCVFYFLCIICVRCYLCKDVKYSIRAGGKVGGMVLCV